MKTNSVRLNVYPWCKTPFSTFSKEIQRRPPIFLHIFSRAPSDLQLCFVQLKTLAPSARYSTFKYPWPWNPGYGSLKVIENYTSWSGTHDFLLTFHSNHRPISHLNWNLASAQRVPNASMMGLPDGRKSFKIGLVVSIKYQLWQDTQPRCRS